MSSWLVALLIAWPFASVALGLVLGPLLKESGR
jgi:hypothetical protein